MTHRAIIPAVMLFALALFASPVRAQAQEEQEATNVFEMFFWSSSVVGITVTWVLILMSVVVVALILQHLMLNKATVIIPPESVLEQEELLSDKQFREAINAAGEDDSVFGQVMHASLSEAANGYGAMERAIEETSDLLGAKRIRSIELLAVFGQVGPMIGLFGTVYGMIEAFDTIVRVGGTPDPAQLAGGIRTALVTTFWGLIVGIPAIAAAALIRNKIDALVVETMIQAELLISQFSPAARKQRPVAAAVAGKPSSSSSSKSSSKSGRSSRSSSSREDRNKD
ncbi:MAG: MotA/TolQ/ExbB proton channel family protein [Phycisphaeraceae bacterium]